MKTFFAIIGFVAVTLVVGTCVACSDDDDSTDSPTSAGHNWSAMRGLTPA